MSILLLFLSFCTLASAGFPHGRCYEPSCEASPFDLTWTSQTNKGGDVIACFKVSSKPCIEGTNTKKKYGCCSTFSRVLYKIVLASRRACTHSVKAVFVNGNKKGGGVYFDNYEGQSELRITNLNINGAKAPGTTVCLQLAKPCNSIADFCIEQRSQLCKFSIFDAGGHQCCPTCYMLDKSQGYQFPPLSPNAPLESPDSPEMPAVPSMPDVPNAPPIAPPSNSDSPDSPDMPTVPSMPGMPEQPSPPSANVYCDVCQINCTTHE